MPDIIDQYRLFYERDGIIHVVREYILSVTAAALISVVVIHLLDKKTPGSTVGKMMACILMMFTVLSPVRNITLSDWNNWLQDAKSDANAAISIGESIRTDALKTRIKETTEAYIINKAATLDVKLQVDVILSDDMIPIPRQVRLQGAISPYAKNRLQEIIEENLGIAKEDQLWI